MTMTMTGKTRYMPPPSDSFEINLELFPAPETNNTVVESFFLEALYS